MLKYKDYYIVFEEIPDKISLAINITNCQNRCKGCHSPELRCNIGKELTYDEIDRIINKNSGINCFVFMGEGNDKDTLLLLAKYIKEKYKIDVAVYSGRNNVEDEYYNVFDYIKIGEYKKEFGPLNVRTTNQRFYKIKDKNIIDITEIFWRKDGF